VVGDVERHGRAWREARPHGRPGDPPSAPVLLLLHGLGGSRISWEPQLRALGTQLHVVAWDLPGYGAAAPLHDGTPTFAELADAAVALLDDVGAARAHVAGISFGGMIAQHLAAGRPERVATLALLATSPRFGLDGTDPVTWRAARLAPLDQGARPADMAERVLRSLAAPGAAESAIGEQVAAMARIEASALRRSIECLVTHDSTALLPRIAAPTLCLVGELDTETPPAYAAAIAALVPHARVVVVPGAGHLVNAEAPDAVSAALAGHALAPATAELR